MAQAVAVYVAQPIQSLVPVLSSPGGPGEMSSTGKVGEAPSAIRRGNTGLALCRRRISRGQGQQRPSVDPPQQAATWGALAMDSGRNPMWPYRERVPGPGCRDHAFSTAPRLSVLPAAGTGSSWLGSGDSFLSTGTGQSWRQRLCGGLSVCSRSSQRPRGLQLRQMGGGGRDLLWLVPAQPCGSAVLAGKSHPC